MNHLNEVKIYQESNRKGEFIAPFIPEHAVYDTEGVRLDVKLKGLDIARIKALLAKISIGGNGISGLIEVNNDEEKFIEEITELMNTVNEAQSGSTKFNTYLAVFKINENNFMEISVPNKSEYALAKVTLSSDGGLDARFEVNFDLYIYHVNGELDSDDNYVSYLYFEERAIG